MLVVAFYKATCEVQILYHIGILFITFICDDELECGSLFAPMQSVCLIWV